MYPPVDSRSFQGASLPWESSARISSSGKLGGSSAFSLIELLVVVAIIGILMTLAIPAFNAINGSGDLNKAASDMQSFLQEARSQAMANSTYVYVGLVEEDGLNPNPTNGVGEIVMAAVASSDGSRPWGANSNYLANNVYPVSKAVAFNNVHLTNAGSLTNGMMANRPGQMGYATPNLPIVDLSSNNSSIIFQYPLAPAVSKYTFQKVIEFDPQGTPRLQTNAIAETSVQNYFEIPLSVAHGNVAPTNSPNQAAVQIDGVTGAVRVYRP